ncbi:CvpA family protein [Maritalea sp. S77]|uniref:CvpA family protein n=1 Tax=Maritalea sp. S77 TaxID=3415125 RepID=UPI003C79BC56
MITTFDIIVGVLVLISALLATMRGFTREVLSLLTWGGSAAFAVWMYYNNPELARNYVADPMVADIVTVLLSFIVALIILHLLTMWIADLVSDSKIGPLDRSLGFVFGGIRGILIIVVLLIFGNWLFANDLRSFAADSKTMPILTDLGEDLIRALPDDVEAMFTDFLRGSSTPGQEVPVTEGTDQFEEELSTSST